MAQTAAKMILKCLELMKGDNRIRFRNNEPRDEKAFEKSLINN